MELIRFEEERATASHLGGKAAGLARLSQLGFPVPHGAVINSEPQNEEWSLIFEWWKASGQKPLAVRSSASAEDGAHTSFAGQNKSFLNIADEESLKRSIHECFESIRQKPNQAYRQFFGNENPDSAMNVVLQDLVKPQFSGVFFSRDPRDKSSGWILEVVEGFGERLVSGQVTPGKISETGGAERLPQGFSKERAHEIARMGLRIRDSLQFEVDMEWAIDENGFLQVLQARPITTLKADGKDLARDSEDLVAEELRRLEKKFPTSTQWDGQTFAEWSGFPSYFTFSIWKDAFSPHHAFGDALKLLGYQSYINAPYEPKDSLLQRVFGRAYVNLNRLTDLYYGPIPYSIEPKPRPHTRFDWRKINGRMLAHLPSALKSMLRVSWNLSTKRKYWLEACTKELTTFKEDRKNCSHHQGPEALAVMSLPELQNILNTSARDFSKRLLLWPFVLVILTESTVQRLTLILSQILGETEAARKIREWMGKGLHTLTMEMQRDHEEACRNPKLRDAFLERYGHRGPGELDLVNPRWSELQEKAFRHNKKEGSSTTSVDTVIVEIQNLQSFKREMVLEEWKLLVQMLELREQWKMEILKPYAAMRELLHKIAKKLELQDDIHWLRLSEVVAAETTPTSLTALALKIQSRKKRFEAFKKYSFPDIISLAQIRRLISSQTPEDAQSFDGEALSPGIICGEVRIVSDPHSTEPDEWPPNTILVAETTDPGWTPLFARAKGLIVERGGVLSHCAIVAREMQIPAVSGIFKATSLFKNGDRLWVDGHQGRIIRE